jgi:hypothetical protein
VTRVIKSKALKIKKKYEVQSPTNQISNDKIEKKKSIAQKHIKLKNRN